MHRDLKELLSMLNAEEVKYLVVGGGYAVSIHAQPRPEIAGVEFDHAWRRRVVVTIDADAGLEAPFIAADELIAAKEAAGRAQDLADAEAIRTAQQSAAPAAKPSRRRPARKPSPKAGR